MTVITRLVGPRICTGCHKPEQRTVAIGIGMVEYGAEKIGSPLYLGADCARELQARLVQDIDALEEAAV